MFYSIIIPVFNRISEIDELLESLTLQLYKDFEVIVVDDGSSIPCEPIINKYQGQLSIKYFYKPNSGPGQTRNYGAERSTGDYLIFFDSDCIVPTQYLLTVENELQSKYVGFFGGPDSADSSFTKMQQAINYSMTSIFTTGGIRGGKARIDRFFPRSFNMGIDKSTFEDVGGFSSMRFGEDIDLSIRVLKKGHRSRLFPESRVFHKRRTDLKKFFKQVFNSGIARINLYKKYPDSLKLIYAFPALFTGYSILLPILTFILGWYILIPFILYFLAIFIDSTVKTKSLSVGLLSMIATFVQLTGYGCGFIYAFWKVIVLKQTKDSAFIEKFYK